ncbi:hypothetical protein Tco_0381160 [Tanacetum coccineum]
MFLKNETTVVLPDSEDEDAEISSKQGRNLQEEGLDEMVASQRSKSVDKGKRYKRRKESKGKDIDTGFEDISTGFEDISTGFEEVNTGGLGVSTGSGPVSSARGQREGKAPMIVEETQAPKRTKEQIQQEEASLAEAIRLQTLKEEETANSHLLYKGTVVKIWRRVQTEISKENKRKLIDKDVSVTRRKRLERSIYQIIRANGADTVYMSFGAMLKDFTREDLIELYRLVMQKYGTNRPEDAYDRVLWSDLRTMFDPPLNEDIGSYPLSKDACQVDAVENESF